MLLPLVPGTTVAKAAVPTVLQAILCIERQDVPDILRTLKGMEEMSSISSLTTAHLKFEKISRVEIISVTSRAQKIDIFALFICGV